MNRHLLALMLTLAALLGLAPGTLQAQAIMGYTYAPSLTYSSPGYFPNPYTTYYYAPAPPQTIPAAPFVGNSYAFYGPGYSPSYYTPSYSNYATSVLGYQTTPYRTPTLYGQPGPYYYTPAQSGTPAYYGYYDTPRFFRY